MAAKKATKTKAGKKRARAHRALANRELPNREVLGTGTNKLFVRRNARGTSFEEVVDVGKSLAADRRTKAKRVVKAGQGERGDRHP